MQLITFLVSNVKL